MAVEEQLQREGAGRRLAAGAAIGAVALSVAAEALLVGAGSRAPAESPGGILEAPRFYRDNAFPLIAGTLLQGVGYLLAALALDRLYLATRFRRRETPRAARPLAYGGALGLAAGGLAAQIAITVASSRYLAERAGDYFAARQLLGSPSVIVPGVISQAGRLALGFAFVFVALNAMRVGLLTRFMGILGVIVGVLLVVPLAQAPVVQWFWLGAVAYLFLGRWPGGVPPAWRTGQAEPWPTAQELRQRRESTRPGAGEGEARSPEPAAQEAPGKAAAPRPHPTSRKRRGKRR